MKRAMIVLQCILAALTFQYGVMATENNKGSRLMMAVSGNSYVALVNKAGLYEWAVVPNKARQFRAVNWNNLPLPDGLTGISNPESVAVGNATLFIIQAVNGQVYSITMEQRPRIEFGRWTMVGSELPRDEGVSFASMDTVRLTLVSGRPYAYARSLTGHSKLYWSTINENGNWSAWQQIGSSSKSLLTDAAVQYNPFTKLYEVYAVMEDGYMYRAWQTSFSKWVGWTKTGYFAPKTQHAPVSHSMSSNFFNGFTNVFVHGADGYIHHISQTTCDKVPNPWGWCTWGEWSKIGSKLPLTRPVMNTLVSANNIHLGIEILTTDSNGKLFYMWQSQRGSKWNGWQAVATSQSAFANLPFTTDDLTGWWTAFGLNSRGDIITVQQKRTFSVSPSQIKYASVATVRWSVPVDQASHLDWIGVYPRGASDRQYIDYYYVGGKQNPYKDAVPTGSLSFKSYLPAGTYEYRYLVNRRYVDAAGAFVQVTSSSPDKEWVQVFRGLFTGLKIANISVTQCVQDAEAVVTTFQKCFAYFEDREIYKGLNYFGYALKDTITSVQACGIPAVVQAIEKLAKDLISCVKGDCKNFLIDTLKEILILYENVYEIYGDIIGAKNSFKLNAYEQGGYCIGRVVHACVTLR